MSARRAFAALVVLGLVARAPTACADDASDVLRRPIVATRRQGFAIGGTLGLRFGSASGLPLAYSDRRPENEVSRGVLAPMGSVFVGAAISDALVFGPVVALGGATRDDVRVKTTGLGFRFDAYPLVSLGGRLADLGLGCDLGTGSASFTRVSTGDALAQSGMYSMVGAHAFFEALRFHGLHVGPVAGVDWRSSATFTWVTGFVGVRGGFYGGP